MSGVIVYTTIFGQSNALPPAPVGADSCVCYVDDESHRDDPKGWHIIVADQPPVNPRREAWFLRCLPPHERFNHCDRVVWIDASFTLTDLPKLLRDAGDAPIAAMRHPERHSHTHEGYKLVKYGQADRKAIHRQLRDYQREGFTSSYCSVSCVIVRDNSAQVHAFNETWAAEIAKHCGDNTQVSLDYSAWKHGLTIKALTGSRKDNPYATHDHADHQRRRKPYDPTGAAA